MKAKAFCETGLMWLMVFSIVTCCGLTKTQKKVDCTDFRAKRQIPEDTYTNSLGMGFVCVRAGTFIMGSPAGESRSPNDEKQHSVTLSKGFYIQATEVTVGQWRAFIRDTGYKTEAEINGGAFVLTETKLRRKKGKFWDNPGFSQTDRHPVTCVSWNDAQAFIKWLNLKEGNSYRLPTEAEWEYACRAGARTTFSFGRFLSTNQANYDGNFPLPGSAKGVYHAKTLPVASFAPNAWGLYDMHGNVWEWCQDWWGSYPPGPVVDPKGPLAGSKWRPNRVTRGGSWLFSAYFCRSAYRFMNTPESSDDTTGFRLVRDF